MVKQRGVALVIAMILLFILTLLAVTGMSMSTAELVMAGNEQFQRRAFDAAGGGVEAAIAKVSVSSGMASETLTGRDYVATLRYAGEESNLPQSSADKFVGRHIEIESTGKSARNAMDVQVQGVLLLVPTNGVADYQQIGTGLEGEAP